MNIKDKAELIYYTGESVVEKTLLPLVLKELEKYNCDFYSDIEINGLVLVQKAKN